MSCGPMNKQNGAAPRPAFAFGDAANNSSKIATIARHTEKIVKSKDKAIQGSVATEPITIPPPPFSNQCREIITL